MILLSEQKAVVSQVLGLGDDLFGQLTAFLGQLVNEDFVVAQQTIESLRLANLMLKTGSVRFRYP